MRAQVRNPYSSRRCGGDTEHFALGEDIHVSVERAHLHDNNNVARNPRSQWHAS
jgi:hypothetical protein